MSVLASNPNLASHATVLFEYTSTTSQEPSCASVCVPASSPSPVSCSSPSSSSLSGSISDGPLPAFHHSLDSLSTTEVGRGNGNGMRAMKTSAPSPMVVALNTQQVYEKEASSGARNQVTLITRTMNEHKIAQEIEMSELHDQHGDHELNMAQLSSLCIDNAAPCTPAHSPADGDDQQQPKIVHISNGNKSKVANRSSPMLTDASKKCERLDSGIKVEEDSASSIITSLQLSALRRRRMDPNQPYIPLDTPQPVVSNEHHHHHHDLDTLSLPSVSFSNPPSVTPSSTAVFGPVRPPELTSPRIGHVAYQPQSQPSPLFQQQAQQFQQPEHYVPQAQQQQYAPPVAQQELYSQPPQSQHYAQPQMLHSQTQFQPEPLYGAQQAQSQQQQQQQHGNDDGLMQDLGLVSPSTSFQPVQSYYAPQLQVSKQMAGPPISILFEQQHSLQNYDLHEGYYSQQVEPETSASGRGAPVRPRTMSSLQTVVESNTKRLCYGETTTTTTTMAKTEELVTLDPSLLDFEGGTISHLSHLNVENCYSYAWRRWSKTDAPVVSKSNKSMAGSVQLPHSMIKDDDRRLFQFILGAPTASGTQVNEMTMTYLNQAQSYEIRIKKLNKATNEANLKTILRVSFVEKRLQYREEEEMKGWARTHPKDRLLDIDFTMSYGVFDISMTQKANYSTQFLWNPSREASIFIKINCISTEFTSKRHGGERGTPLRLVAETFSTETDVLLDTCSCVFKVFKSKGAERKHKTDRIRVSKNSDADVCFLPSYDCTLFTTYKDGEESESPATPSTLTTTIVSVSQDVDASIAGGHTFVKTSSQNRSRNLKAVAAAAAANVKSFLRSGSRTLSQSKSRDADSLRYSQPALPSTSTMCHTPQQGRGVSISATSPGFPSASETQPQADASLLPTAVPSADLSSNTQHQASPPSFSTSMLSSAYSANIQQQLFPSAVREEGAPSPSQVQGQFNNPTLNYAPQNDPSYNRLALIDYNQNQPQQQQNPQQAEPYSPAYQPNPTPSPSSYSRSQPTPSPLAYSQSHPTPSPSPYGRIQSTPSPVVPSTSQHSPSFNHLAHQQQQQPSSSYAQATPGLLAVRGSGDSALGDSGGSTSAEMGRHLASDADAVATARWLIANRFHRVASILEEFTAEDLRDMSQEELVELCEARDGIRLYKRLHKVKGTKLSVYISMNGSEHYALYLGELKIEHFRLKMMHTLSESAISIRNIHLSGPKGIKVKLTDQVIENMANESIFDCQFIQAPVRRTTAYLEACKLLLRPRVKIMEIHYNNYWKDKFNPNRIPYPQHDSHVGLREFYFWHMPQVQYMNPDVQIVRFLEMSPHPYIRCWLDDGRDVIFDCDSQSKQTIMDRLVTTLGKTPEMIQYEKATNVKQVGEDNQAIFGVDRKRFCMCEVEGQCPCPGVVKLPKSITGKYGYLLKEDFIKEEKEIVEGGKEIEDFEPPFISKINFFNS